MCCNCLLAGWLAGSAVACRGATPASPLYRPPLASTMPLPCRHPRLLAGAHPPPRRLQPPAPLPGGRAAAGAGGGGMPPFTELPAPCTPCRAHRKRACRWLCVQSVQSSLTSSRTSLTNAPPWAPTKQAVYDFVESLEGVQALKFSLATTFPRRVYGQGELYSRRLAELLYPNPNIHAMSGCILLVARAAALAAPMPGPALARNRTPCHPPARPLPLPLPSLPPRPAADCLQRSLEELDLAPQAVLLMQPEDD